MAEDKKIKEIADHILEKIAKINDDENTQTDIFSEGLNDEVRVSDEYTAFVNGRQNNSNKLALVTSQIHLPNWQLVLDLCPFANAYVGRETYDDNLTKIELLKNHIADAEKNPNAKVLLLGDMFSFPKGCRKIREAATFSIEQQADIIAELFHNLADDGKIIGIIDGTDEERWQKIEGINPNKLLSRYLGVKDKYFGKTFEGYAIFNNAWTDYTDQTVPVYFRHGYLQANSFATTFKKILGLQQIVAGKEIYGATHYNKLASFIQNKMGYNLSQGNPAKFPQYFESIAGYVELANELQKDRNEDSGTPQPMMLRTFVVPNIDNLLTENENSVSNLRFKTVVEHRAYGCEDEKDFHFGLIERVNSGREFIENYYNKEIDKLENEKENSKKEVINKQLIEFNNEENKNEYLIGDEQELSQEK